MNVISMMIYYIQLNSIYFLFIFSSHMSKHKNSGWIGHVSSIEDVQYCCGDGVKSLAGQNFNLEHRKYVGYRGKLNEKTWKVGQGVQLK